MPKRDQKPDLPRTQSGRMATPAGSNIASMADSPQVAQIVASLRHLQDPDAGIEYLILTEDQHSTYYIQFAREKKDPSKLHVEAVSNNFLKPPYILDLPQMVKLQSLGWNPPEDTAGGCPNFYSEPTVNDDEGRQALATLAYRTFMAVYGLPQDGSITPQVISFQAKVPPRVTAKPKRKRRSDAFWPPGTKDYHTDSRMVGARLPTDMADQVKAVAEAEGKSVNAWLRDLIAQHLDES